MAIAFIAGYTPSDRTQITRSSGLSTFQSDSGVLRHIDLGPATYWKVDLNFGPLSEAERSTLEDWLVTNEKAEIDITVQSKVYRGYIWSGSGIKITTTEGGALWFVEFSFLGAKQ